MSNTRCQREPAGLLPFCSAGSVLPWSSQGRLPTPRRGPGASRARDPPRAAVPERPGRRHRGRAAAELLRSPQRPRKEVVAFLAEEKGSRSGCLGGAGTAPAARSGLRSCRLPRVHERAPPCRNRAQPALPAEVRRAQPPARSRGRPWGCGCHRSCPPPCSRLGGSPLAGVRGVQAAPCPLRASLSPRFGFFGVFSQLCQ